MDQLVLVTRSLKTILAMLVPPTFKNPQHKNSEYIVEPAPDNTVTRCLYLLQVALHIPAYLVGKSISCLRMDTEWKNQRLVVSKCE